MNYHSIPNHMYLCTDIINLPLQNDLMQFGDNDSKKKHLKNDD